MRSDGRDRAAEADRDGRRGLAGLGGQLRDAPRGQPEGRAPDVDRGDDVAARVVDRGGDGVEAQLVLADGRSRSRAGGSAPAPRGVARARRSSARCSSTRPRRTMRSTSRSASDGHQDLARRHAVERRRSAGPVADGDEVRAVDLGDGQQRVAVEDAEPGRLVGQPREPLELGHRDAAQVERPLGPLGQADDDEPEPVLAGLVVLFDQARASGASPAAARPSTCAGRAGGRARSRRPRPATRRGPAGAPPPGRPSGPRCRRGPSPRLAQPAAG